MRMSFSLLGATNCYALLFLFNPPQDLPLRSLLVGRLVSAIVVSARFNQLPRHSYFNRLSPESFHPDLVRGDPTVAVYFMNS